jgi:hypothetical protein
MATDYNILGEIRWKMMEIAGKRRFRVWNHGPGYRLFSQETVVIKFRVNRKGLTES